jgi:Tol biopolymer transport system component
VKRAASALLIACTACGGQSQREVPRSASMATALDAVLLVASETGPVEHYGLRRGEGESELLGSADGNSVLSPDRRRLFLEKDDGSLIVSVDGAVHAVQPDTGHALAWSLDGERLARVESGHLVVSAADGSEPVVVSAGVEGGSFGPIAWAPDGSRVALGIGTSVVQALRDGSEAAVTVTGPTPLMSDVSWALSPVWAPDSSSLAVISNAQSALFIGDDGTALELELDAVTPSFGWSNDSSWFAVRTTGLECVVARPDGTTERALGAQCQTGSWSPVDARLLFNTAGDVGTWAPGDAPHSLGRADSYSASWSPDGTVIAYRSLSASEHVFADSWDGSELLRVSLDQFRWNATGTRVFLLHSDGTLATTDARLAQQRTLAEGVTAAAWLPDGESLAIATSGEAFTLRADGEERTSALVIPPSATQVGWLEPSPAAR